MRAISFTLVVLCSLAFAGFSTNESLHAQELKKVRADYFSGPTAYSPSDPWTRSKVFQAHTGHSGFFYNCDNEECKRNSPYIYWTTNCQPLWPKRLGFFNGFRQDRDKVLRRINNGACGCPDCGCEQTCETCLAAKGQDSNLRTAKSDSSTMQR